MEFCTRISPLKVSKETILIVYGCSREPWELSCGTSDSSLPALPVPTSLAQGRSALFFTLEFLSTHGTEFRLCRLTKEMDLKTHFKMLESLRWFKEVTRGWDGRGERMWVAGGLCSQPRGPLPTRGPCKGAVLCPPLLPSPVRRHPWNTTNGTG